MMLVGVLLVWSPAILLALGLVLTRLAGCEVDEAGKRPCLLMRVDVGGVLNALVMIGWLVIPLLPFMALSVLGAFVAGAMALLGVQW